MVESDATDESQAATRDEIMAAARQALERHGVNDLTTHNIADEWGKSQSLLHYYYDTKEDLLVAFIDHLRAQSEESYRARASDPPLDRVRWFLDHHLDDATADERRAFSTALLELHSKASHNERYREALDGYEADAREFVATAIRDGTEAGTFADVDAEEVATVLLSAHDGGLLRARVLGRAADASVVRAGLETYIESVLLTESGRVEAGADAGEE